MREFFLKGMDYHIILIIANATIKSSDSIMYTQIINFYINKLFRQLCGRHQSSNPFLVSFCFASDLNGFFLKKEKKKSFISKNIDFIFFCLFFCFT